MTFSSDRPSRLDLVRSGYVNDAARTGRLVVAIDKVSEDPANERKVYRRMEGLIESVRSLGVIEPITVTPVEGGRYQIVTGHRRYRAARAAGRAQIEVIVREPESSIELRRKSLVSNIQREDIGPIELAEALARQLTEDSALGTQARLAEAIGKDESWVSAMLRVLTLPNELREKLGTSQLSLSWESVARIARIPDAKTQTELVDALLVGATHQEIRQGIKRAKSSQHSRREPHPKCADTVANLVAHKMPEIMITTEQAFVFVRGRGDAELTEEFVRRALENALASSEKNVRESSTAW